MPTRSFRRRATPSGHTAWETEMKSASRWCNCCKHTNSALWIRIIQPALRTSPTVCNTNLEHVVVPVGWLPAVRWCTTFQFSAWRLQAPQATKLWDHVPVGLGVDVHFTDEPYAPRPARINQETMGALLQKGEHRAEFVHYVEGRLAQARSQLRQVPHCACSVRGGADNLW